VNSEGAPAQTSERTLVGQGRSAQVFRVRLPSGAPAALKVFHAEGATRVIQDVFLGHPNPYTWSVDACETAHRRRRVLAALTRALLGPDLRVATSLGAVRDATTGRLALLTEWVQGRAPRLRGPFSLEACEHDRTALRRAMKAFQGLARESGMWGLLWQAGWGNPVAANNFLLLAPPSPEGVPVAWIDLESAYPPLASPSPWAQLCLYLPRSVRSALRTGQPLFDDVDVPTLRRFLDAHAARLVERLGAAEHAVLLEDVEALAQAQARWKAVSRLDGQLAWREQAGELTPSQAAWYRGHKLAFVGRLVGEVAWTLLRLPVRIAVGLARRLWRMQLLRRLRAFGAFLVSDAARQRAIDAYVDARLAEWSTRGQISPAERAALLAEREEPAARHLLTDLVCQSLGTVPFSETLRATAAVLLVRGQVDPALGGLLVATPGSFTRPLYAFLRLLGGRPRWAHALAMPLSTAPLVGKAAYCVPLALVGRRSGSVGPLGAFLYYDSLARVGRRLPIWGGRDTATEHFTNRTVGRFLSAPVRWLLGRRKAVRVAEPPRP
jgi:hypothetical protein